MTALFPALLAPLVATALVMSAGSPGVVVYVDDTAAGPVHDGASWASAYLTLQDALAAPVLGGGGEVVDAILTSKKQDARKHDACFYCVWDRKFAAVQIPIPNGHGSYSEKGQGSSIGRVTHRALTLSGEGYRRTSMGLKGFLQKTRQRRAHSLRRLDQKIPKFPCSQRFD